MWPLLLAFARTYAPYIVWPVAAVVGVVGYNVERVVRGDEKTPCREKSVSEERDERFIKENTNKNMSEIDSLKKRSFVPKTIFERNS